MSRVAETLPEWHRRLQDGAGYVAPGWGQKGRPARRSFHKKPGGLVIRLCVGHYDVSSVSPSAGLSFASVVCKKAILPAGAGQGFHAGVVPSYSRRNRPRRWSFGYDLIHKVIQSARQIGEHDVKAVPTLRP